MLIYKKIRNEMVVSIPVSVGNENYEVNNKNKDGVRISTMILFIKFLNVSTHRLEVRIIQAANAHFRRQAADFRQI